MALIEETREKVDEVIEATPDEVRDMARQAARSAKRAAEDAAKLAAMAAGAAATAARTGHEAYSAARDEGQPVTDAARTATRRAVAVGHVDEDADPADAHQEEYVIHDDEDD